MCYRFSLSDKLSLVRHCVLQVSTVTSGPTGFHCCQRSNTVCYIFPLLSVVQHCVLHIPAVISGPTLCVTYSHSYQCPTLCYRFPLLSAVQHCVLQVSTVISDPTLSQPPPSSTSAPEAPPFCLGPSRCPRERTWWTSGGYSEATPRKWLP